MNLDDLDLDWLLSDEPLNSDGLKNVNFLFDKSKLSPVMEDALEGVVMEFQEVCNEGIVFDVFPVDFPVKFCIRTFWCDSFVLWNPIKSRYSEIPGTQVKRGKWKVS